jgi:hypothetical protein
MCGCLTQRTPQTAGQVWPGLWLLWRHCWQWWRQLRGWASGVAGSGPRMAALDAYVAEAACTRMQRLCPLHAWGPGASWSMLKRFRQVRFNTAVLWCSTLTSHCRTSHAPYHEPQQTRAGDEDGAHLLAAGTTRRVLHLASPPPPPPRRVLRSGSHATEQHAAPAPKPVGRGRVSASVDSDGGAFEEVTQTAAARGGAPRGSRARTEIPEEVEPAPGRRRVTASRATSRKKG